MGFFIDCVNSCVNDKNDGRESLCFPFFFVTGEFESRLSLLYFSGFL